MPIFTKAQQNLFDYENSIKFARYLKTSRQYSFAAEEYERLNFLWPKDTIVVLELVQTYRLNHQCEKLIPSLKLLSIEELIYKNPTYTKEYLRYALNCKSSNTQYFDFASLLPVEEEVFYKTSFFWINQQYDSLSIFYKREKDYLARTHPNFFDLTKNFDEQKYKKPAAAFLMSSIVPGSGKAYTKRWGDAFVSFIFIGTNAYASYRAFKKKGVKSANGWIFGGLAFSFYTANLWGSVKAVKKYNNDIRLNYQNNAETIIYNSY